MLHQCVDTHRHTHAYCASNSFFPYLLCPINSRIWYIHTPLSFTLHFLRRPINGLSATQIRHNKGGIPGERDCKEEEVGVGSHKEDISILSQSKLCMWPLNLSCIITQEYWQRLADWVSKWAISHGSPYIQSSVYDNMSGGDTFLSRQ